MRRGRSPARRLTAVACLALVALAGACSSADSARPSAQIPSEDPPIDAVATTDELPGEAVLCEDIAPEPGQGALEPTGTSSEFSTARRTLQENLAEFILSIGAGGTSSYVGRITLGLNTRDPAVLQSALDLVDTRLMCFELPPVDFDDETPVPAVWTLANPVDPEATSLTLLVDDPSRDCGHNPEGRVLPPTVEESETEVRITIELTPLPWGVYECEGWGPVTVVVDLTQPLGDRHVS